MKTRIAIMSWVLVLSTAGCAHSGPRSEPQLGTEGASANVTGRWAVTLSQGGETITGLALLIQTGTEVSGSMGPNEDNQHPLVGVVDGNVISLTMRPRPGRTTAFARSNLTVTGGTMSGTTEQDGSSDRGTIELERLPD